jgi:hypothetical protein
VGDVDGAGSTPCFSSDFVSAGDASDFEGPVDTVDSDAVVVDSDASLADVDGGSSAHATDGVVSAELPMPNATASPTNFACLSVTTTPRETPIRLNVCRSNYSTSY